MSRERELLQWSYDILECIGWQIMPVPRETFKARLSEISAILSQPEAEPSKTVYGVLATAYRQNDNAGAARVECDTPATLALSELMLSLDKELLDTKLVTASQWNAGIAPSLSNLAMRIDELELNRNAALAECERLRKQVSTLDALLSKRPCQYEKCIEYHKMRDELSKLKG